MFKETILHKAGCYAHGLVERLPAGSTGKAVSGQVKRGARDGEIESRGCLDWEGCKQGAEWEGKGRGGFQQLQHASGSYSHSFTSPSPLISLVARKKAVAV